MGLSIQEKFKSMGLSIQEKKFKTNFQDGNCDRHLVFPIGTNLAIFDQQVTLMILTKFQVNWPLGHGGHFGFPVGTILAIFDL